MKRDFFDFVDLFELNNHLTENHNIWVGHAAIGTRGKLTISEAKYILSSYFGEQLEENKSIPERISRTFKQWESAHPMQKVHQSDQPLFVKIDGDNIEVAAIWPWQIKEGVASLMLYRGKLVD